VRSPLGIASNSKVLCGLRDGARRIAFKVVQVPELLRQAQIYGRVLLDGWVSHYAC
jgi:hypothetical protein